MKSAPRDAELRAGCALVAVAAEVRFAAVDVLDDEDRAVERVQLEVPEVLTEQGEVEDDAAAEYLPPSSYASTISGSNCSSADQRLRAARRRNGSRRLERRAVEVEAARLIAARIAAVEQQVVVRLVREHRRAGELVLLRLSSIDTPLSSAVELPWHYRPRIACTVAAETPGWPSERQQQRLVGVQTVLLLPNVASNFLRSFV